MRNAASIFTIAMLLSGGSLMLFYLFAPTNEISSPREGLGAALSPAVNVDTLTLGLDREQPNPLLDIEMWIHLSYVPPNEQKPAYVMFVLPFHVNNYLISQGIPQRWNVIPASKVAATIVYTQVSNDSLHFNSTFFRGLFLVDRTFESSQRGIFTVVLPFGLSVDAQEFPEINSVQEQLGVGFRSPPANSMYIYVTIPRSAENIQAFPEPKSRTPYVEYLGNQTKISVEWILTEAQTVTISYDDSYAKSLYDSFVIIGSLFVGVGASGILDWLKEVSRSEARRSELKGRLDC